MKYYKIQNRSRKNSHSCVPLKSHGQLLLLGGWEPPPRRCGGRGRPLPRGDSPPPRLRPHCEPEYGGDDADGGAGRRTRAAIAGPRQQSAASGSLLGGHAQQYQGGEALNKFFLPFSGSFIAES
jgi:hypothetical protein